ncbi:MAG: hypothetical protein IPI60_14455 [Saprospiraceae bacterium]|nr:hypothetical protein [Saprospiraceae bacterium]
MVLTNIPGRGDEKGNLGAQAGIGVRLKSGTGFLREYPLAMPLEREHLQICWTIQHLEYVFEEKEEGFRLIPTTLSYAQSQVWYAGWERGRWRGKAGIQMNVSGRCNR